MKGEKRELSLLDLISYYESGPVLKQRTPDVIRTPSHPGELVYNYADDDEAPGKTLTRKAKAKEFHKKAVGLTDIPGASPAGAQGYRPRSGYEQQDFEASFVTGFGGPSVIDIEEDKPPSNISRLDTRLDKDKPINIPFKTEPEDIFSFFETGKLKRKRIPKSGAIMNLEQKELIKLATALEKSGYTGQADNVFGLIKNAATVAATPKEAFKALLLMNDGDSVQIDFSPFNMYLKKQTSSSGGQITVAIAALGTTAYHDSERFNGPFDEAPASLTRNFVTEKYTAAQKINKLKNDHNLTAATTMATSSGQWRYKEVVFTSGGKYLYAQGKPAVAGDPVTPWRFEWYGTDGKTGRTDYTTMKELKNNKHVRQAGSEGWSLKIPESWECDSTKCWTAAGKADRTGGTGSRSSRGDKGVWSWSKDRGSAETEKVQKAMNTALAKTPKVMLSNGKNQLTVDGKWGGKTWEAWNRLTEDEKSGSSGLIALVADGITSSEKAIAKITGETEDVAREGSWTEGLKEAAAAGELSKKQIKGLVEYLAHNNAPVERKGYTDMTGQEVARAPAPPKGSVPTPARDEILKEDAPMERNKAFGLMQAQPNQAAVVTWFESDNEASDGKLEEALGAAIMGAEIQTENPVVAKIHALGAKTDADIKDWVMTNKVHNKNHPISGTTHSLVVVWDAASKIADTLFSMDYGDGKAKQRVWMPIEYRGSKDVGGKGYLKGDEQKLLVSNILERDKPWCDPDIDGPTCGSTKRMVQGAIAGQRRTSTDDREFGYGGGLFGSKRKEIMKAQEARRARKRKRTTREAEDQTLESTASLRRGKISRITRISRLRAKGL